MKYWRLHMDWALLIRSIFGMMFIVIAFYFNDWLPAIFGLAIIIIGIIGAFTKKGCGYSDNCNR